MLTKPHLRTALIFSASVLLSVGIYHQFKPLPAGLSVATPFRPVSHAQFLGDVTFLDPQGQRQSEQEIFDAIFEMIAKAQHTIVLDMFLFNAFQGQNAEKGRALASELVAALVNKKQASPQLQILVISDPFNQLYGGVVSPEFKALEAAGIPVVLTDLKRLRDSNPSWSSFWRLCCGWLGNSTAGWLPSPLDTDKVSLRSYLSLLNFKANHRKTLVVDLGGNNWEALVSSANPHDGSSAHSNVALRFRGPAALDLLESELAVARFSGMPTSFDPAKLPAPPLSSQLAPEQARLQILTEKQILEGVLQTLSNSQAGDSVDIAMFYFSHRQLVKALIAAQQRGVKVRLLLDPNKDAFGRQKNGIPNRQVAWELHQAGLDVRWCNTHGEQCHSKFILSKSKYEAHLILGSGNYTRRNLDDYNLESCVHWVSEPQHPVIASASHYFDQHWSNPGQRVFSLPYADFADTSRLKYWQYRLMEASGWSTF